VVVLLTCGVNQCTTIEDAIALAQGVYAKLKERVVAPGGAQ
jgi:hypothetical protein